MPSRNRIQRVVMNLCREFAVTRVRLASDSAEHLEHWQHLLPTFGLSSWILKTDTHGELAGAQLFATEQVNA